MDLLNTRVGKLFRKYLIAACGSALIFSIYTMVDIICVGQYEGPDGAAALACVTPIFSVFMSLGMLLGIGGAVHMSLCRGEGRHQEGDRYFVISLLAGLVLSAVMTVVGMAYCEEVLRLLGADDQIIGLAMAYSKYVFPTFPCFLLGQLFIAYIRNDGAPLLCTAAVMTGGILNIFLDVFLVFTMEMGAAGAGLATGIGQTVAVLVLLSYFLRKSCRLRLIRPVRCWHTLRQIVQSGFAPFIVDLSYGFAVALFNNQIMRYGTSTELAAYGTMSNVAITFQSFFYGVGQALQPIASTNYGAGRRDRVRQVLTMALTTTAIMSVAFFVIVQLFPRQLLGIYMDVTPEVLAVGPGIMRRYDVSLLLSGVNIAVSYYLQSVLRSGQSVLVSLCRGCLFLVPFLYVLPLLPWGITGLWWAMPVTELCTILVAVWFLRRDSKLSKLPNN